MKKAIADKLRMLADKLSPAKKQVEKVDGMSARKLGLAFTITKKDVREYRKHHQGEYKSFRKAKKALVREMKNQIGMSIAGTIAKRNLIKYHVGYKGGEYIVCGHLNVYVDEKDINTESNTD